MSILDKIQKTAAIVPRITIYGTPGIGKSTLASQFPEPLFLLTEKTIEGVNAIPPAETLDEFWKNLRALYALENPPFKTLVIDSISKLDKLVVDYILDNEVANIKCVEQGKPKQITAIGSACGGYGKGYERAQSIHRAVKAFADKFTDKGIGVIFVAHDDVSKYKSPDSEDYDIYTIVMNHNKSREVYIHDVDAVFFGRLQSFVETLDSGKHIAKSTQKRILVTGVNNANVSKNRFSMPPEIPMEFEEIKKYIPFYNQGGKS